MRNSKSPLALLRTRTHLMANGEFFPLMSQKKRETLRRKTHPGSSRLIGSTTCLPMCVSASSRNCLGMVAKACENLSGSPLGTMKRTRSSGILTAVAPSVKQVRHEIVSITLRGMSSCKIEQKGALTVRRTLPKLDAQRPLQPLLPVHDLHLAWQRFQSPLSRHRPRKN